MSNSGFPTIIWALERTGGSTLTKLISLLTGYPERHEPFSLNGWFAVATKAWNVDRNCVPLAAVLAEKYVIKHEFHWFDDDFNLDLMAHADRARYRHIHLVRRDTFARLASKGIAVSNKNAFDGLPDTIKRSDAPLPAIDVPSLIAAHRIAERKQRTIQTLLRRRFHSMTIHFESLYRGAPIHRLNWVRAIADFLAIPENQIRDKRPDIDHLLTNRDQETSYVYSRVPNINELREALQ